MQNTNIEIEKKFLIKEMPDLSTLPKREIVQGYLCTDPTIRIRKDNDEYYMTYKGKGMLVKAEYNLPLNENAFYELLPKCKGKLIEKTRYEYKLPKTCDSAYGRSLIAEIDIFHDRKMPIGSNDSYTADTQLKFLEVEFENEAQASGFIKPDWFGCEVTDDPSFYNSSMI